MNIVILTGRLTKDPELNYIQDSQTAVGKFTIAVDKDFKKEGEQVTADFINCVVWKKAAENLKKYFSKGMKINVQGRLSVRKWQNNEGENRYTTEVVVEKWEFGESKRKGDEGNRSGSGPGPKDNNEYPDSGSESVDDCDEIPF